jgi:hypothetical protein
MRTMANERLRLRFAECSSSEEIAEVWQSELRREQRLNQLGFDGDGDVPVLGLEEMEDEVTMADAERRLALGLRDERLKYRAIRCRARPRERRGRHATRISTRQSARWTKMASKDWLADVLTLAKDLDMRVSPNGSKLTLLYDAHAIFVGSPEQCYAYLEGWRDGREHYLRYESRGANE